MAKRDYYEVLGVSKSASADEIKKAFRRLAVMHHPDKEGGDETKFKEINEAYEVLKDSDKRQRYDQFGHAGVGGNGGGGGAYDFNGGGFNFNGQSMNFDFGDLGDMFGSFFGGSSNQRQQERRGRDVETAVELSFEEAVFGAERDIHLNLDAECEHCSGNGAEPGYEVVTCPTCKGSGQVVSVTQTIIGNIQQARTCSDCNGTGKKPEKNCSVCAGKGVKRKEQTVELKIPAGIDDGATIRLRGYGETARGGSKGDLYVFVRVKSHKKFTREGDIILSRESIDMVTAALGGEVEVETVDGKVTMKIPAGTQSGTDFKISNKGVKHPKGTGRGPHIVTINVMTPTKLSKSQKELLEAFKKDSGKRHFF